MKKISTRQYSFIALGSAFVLVFSYYFVARAIFGNEVPVHLTSILAFIASLIAGSPGILFISRREGPSFSGSKYVYGNLAIVSGIAWVLTFTFPAILIFIRYLMLLADLLAR